MAEYIDTASKPMDMPMKASKGPSVFYPHLCITSKEEMNLPDEGECMVRYKKVEDSKNVKNSEYRCDLEITGIKPMGGTMAKPKGKSFSESLDEIAAEKGKPEGADDEMGMEE